MSFWDDIGGTLGGAASGAVTGFELGGPWGAAAGAGLGGGLGYLSSSSAHSAADAQRGALDDAMKRLQQFSMQQQQKRQEDLKNTMAFYGPADSYLHSIYAQPPAQPAPNSMPGGTRVRPMGALGG